MALSLIEVLLALAVLSIGVLALAMAQMGAGRLVVVATHLQRAAELVENEVADVRAVRHSVGEGPCHGLTPAEASAGWVCQWQLRCLSFGATACRTASVRVQVSEPGGLEHSAYSAVTWPESAP